MSNISRLITIIKLFKENDLNTECFTKKEFDKVFKNQNISLNWLKENGISAYNNVWGKFSPLAEIIKDEEFEMPYKSPSRNPQKILWSVDKQCEIKECNVNDYNYNNKIKTLIDTLYGQVEIKTIEKNTFIAHKYYYKLNIEKMYAYLKYKYSNGYGKYLQAEYDDHKKQCDRYLEQIEFLKNLED